MHPSFLVFLWTFLCCLFSVANSIRSIFYILLIFNFYTAIFRDRLSFINKSARCSSSIPMQMSLPHRFYSFLSACIHHMSAYAPSCYWFLRRHWMVYDCEKGFKFNMSPQQLIKRFMDKVTAFKFVYKLVQFSGYYHLRESVALIRAIIDNICLPFFGPQKNSYRNYQFIPNALGNAASANTTTVPDAVLNFIRSISMCTVFFRRRTAFCRDVNCTPHIFEIPDTINCAAEQIFGKQSTPMSCTSAFWLQNLDLVVGDLRLSVFFVFLIVIAPFRRSNSSTALYMSGGYFISFLGLHKYGPNRLFSNLKTHLTVW